MRTLAFILGVASVCAFSATALAQPASAIPECAQLGLAQATNKPPAEIARLKRACNDALARRPRQPRPLPGQGLVLHDSRSANDARVRQAQERQRQLQAQERQRQLQAQERQRQEMERRRAAAEQQRFAAHDQQRRFVEMQRRAAQEQQRRMLEDQQRRILEQQRRALQQQQELARQQAARSSAAPAPAPPPGAAPPAAMVPPPAPPAPAAPDGTSPAADAAVVLSQGGDASVFGVRLGERIALPQCAGDSAADTCVLGGLSGAATVASTRSKLGRFPPRLPGVVEVPVRVGRRSCPDWLSAGATGCTVFLSTIDGAVASAFLFVGASQQSIIDAALAEKYGKTAILDPQSRCESDLAKVRLWPMNTIGAIYDPVLNCNASLQGSGGGVVQVVTRSYAIRLKSPPPAPRPQPTM